MSTENIDPNQEPAEAETEAHGRPRHGFQPEQGPDTDPQRRLRSSEDADDGPEVEAHGRPRHGLQPEDQDAEDGEYGRRL